MVTPSPTQSTIGCLKLRIMTPKTPPSRTSPRLFGRAPPRLDAPSIPALLVPSSTPRLEPLNSWRASTTPPAMSRVNLPTTFKRKTGVLAFCRESVYIYRADERVSSAAGRFVIRWASVVNPFCELVASGMSSQRFVWTQVQT